MIMVISERWGTNAAQRVLGLMTYQQKKGRSHEPRDHGKLGRILAWSAHHGLQSPQWKGRGRGDPELLGIPQLPRKVKGGSFLSREPAGGAGDILTILPQVVPFPLLPSFTVFFFLSFFPQGKKERERDLRNSRTEQSHVWSLLQQSGGGGLPSKINTRGAGRWACGKKGLRRATGPRLQVQGGLWREGREGQVCIWGKD